MKTTAIVVAAGKGVRFGSKEKKPFVKLRHKPLLSYALTALQQSPKIDDIVLVVDGSSIEKAGALTARYGITKVRRIVAGGKIRSQSVRNGLGHIDSGTSLVLIHDGVRPFVSKDLVERLIAAAKKFGAAISAVPVKPTIKLSKDGLFVSYTPERHYLWEAQTPQVFRKELIEKAYKKIGTKGLTDDAALIELAGAKVRLVQGDYKNIKITTREDLKIAEALVKK
ncbi:MAG: 2-C-methyl-D-erythritol 4-phosphate cytidylyltransferase [Candidatus Omnitrophica bacterium]|nr:2-C-methyl-D-erythritol 4-phosphate cytidylyltransferase [Candidatus Omnitrophota bacterium]